MLFISTTSLEHIITFFLNMETSEFEKSLLPSLVKADTKDNACWELTNTSKTGRGICARRDIETNELIFTESHLLCGPIFAALKQRCVSCHIEMAQTSVCTRNCGLPLCRHKPACTDTHKAECDLIMSWIPINGSVIRPNIIKALTAIRALLLADERDMSLLRLLQANRVQQNERIISQMISEFQQPPSKEVIEFLQHVVAVLNTNAFQVVTNNNKGSSAVQLKGLYAFAGQLNHDCSPNTRHSVNDGDLLMSVYASRSIKSGEELTTSYTNPLWNTQSRRTHLQMTKQFLCQCRRCQDRTEFGSHLAAVKCLRKECEGFLLPTDAKVVAGQWSCEVCADIMEFGRICSVHEVLANVVQQTLSGSVRSLIDELAMGGGILTRMVPESNQFFVELKLQVVWKLDVTAKETTQEHIEAKAKFCVDILNILKTLGTGECNLKGLINYELYNCYKMLMPKKSSEENTFYHNCDELLRTSKTILNNNKNIIEVNENYIIC